MARGAEQAREELRAGGVAGAETAGRTEGTAHTVEEEEEAPMPAGDVAGRAEDAARVADVEGVDRGEEAAASGLEAAFGASLSHPEDEAAAPAFEAVPEAFPSHPAEEVVAPAFEPASVPPVVVGVDVVDDSFPVPAAVGGGEAPPEVASVPSGAPSAGVENITALGLEAAPEASLSRHEGASQALVPFSAPTAEGGAPEHPDPWGNQGLDQPGVPFDLADVAEAEKELWREHVEMGSALENTLTAALDLHKTKGPELHKENAELRSDVERVRGIITEMGLEALKHGSALVRAEEEHDAQRTLAEQRARETEQLSAMLREKDEVLAAEQGQLRQLREAAIGLLTEALMGEGIAVTASQASAEDRGASMSELLHEINIAQAQLVEEKGRTEELRKAAADASAQMESLQVTYSEVQKELNDLEGVTVAVSRELEGEGAQSGSSVASRLRALGDRVTEHLKGSFRLGIQKALSVVSTHFIIDLEALTAGYVVTEDLDDDAVVAVVGEADAAAEGPAAKLSALLEGDVFPGADKDADAAAAGPSDGGDTP
ncbi:unnamed protein product [Urochloa humidicola]